MILKDYKTLSDAAYEAFCNRLLERCAGDERFSSLDTRRTELSEHLEIFVEVLSRMPGSKEVTLERNVARTALTHVVDNMAREVEILSNNNPELELAAGFNIRRSYEPHHGDLPRPICKKIVNGPKSGHVKITLKPIKGAANYAIEQSVDGGETWTNGQYSTSSRIDLYGFEAGTNVRFRICALGTRNRKSDQVETSIWVS